MTEHAKARIALDPSRRYYFVGIGGISMSALAKVLLGRGFRVGGSDARPSALLEQVRALGGEVAVGHDAAQLRQDDVLVLSDAINPENPEWRRAVEWSLPVIKRADLLGHLTNSGRGLAVSGTHGKTTTSGMLALILVEAGLDPTCFLGGELTALGGNLRVGGPLVVVEACEAYNSFLDLIPEAAIVTNIEVDHLHFHGTPEHLYESFRQFLRQVRALAVLNGDDALLREMRAIPPRAITYGLDAGNDYQAVDVRLGADTAFTLRRGGARLGEITLQVPGIHNVSNATGAAALALELGAEFSAVQRALAAFPGMHRRFERVGMCGDVAVVDDYAHHPTEIRVTLAAARAVFPGRITAVFQPHLFSRTRDLLDEFSQAFTQADAVCIAPIYPAREAPIPGVDHRQLAERIAARQPGTPVLALTSLEEAVQILAHAAGVAGGAEQPGLLPSLHNGDVIITIGAGDVDSLARALVQCRVADVER
ncbi:MAG: UDP-N-acetylmuramate--L-alanine ligase [Armatimonadota bacterium]